MNHSKKRNSSLVYEFLVRHISKCLVEGDNKGANAALSIVKKYYRSDSNIHKEHRLINALVNTTVSSHHVAASIIEEARNAARSYDTAALDKEKTSLIHAINKKIGDSGFYEHHIEDYKAHATAQVLLNLWRSGDASSIDKRAMYEDTLLQRLTTPKLKATVAESNDLTPGMNKTLFRVMLKKLNEKYKTALTLEQKSLLKAYAFSAANDDDTVVKKMCEIKEGVVQKINEHLDREPEGYVSKKLLETRDVILGTNPEQTDGCVADFMLYAKLKSELESEDR